MLLLPGQEPTRTFKVQQRMAELGRGKPLGAHMEERMHARSQTYKVEGPQQQIELQIELAEQVP
eukprot:903086-Prorocentrum_minimum.AAC.2